MPTLIKTGISLEEYLEKEFSAITKSEFINAEIIQMPYTSQNHGQISSNLHGLLFICLKGQDYRLFIADRMLYILDTGNVYYPDLMIITGQAQSHQMSINMNATLNPTVLIEILSESNAENDLLNKLSDYKKIPALQQYLIFWQNKKQVESFVRVNQGNDWLNTIYSEQSTRVKILHCEISLEEIYEKVEFI